MSFDYKNPITPLYSLGNWSVQRQNIFGTNFSVLGTGGYMEVYSLSDLYFTIPSGTTGLVEYSGNTIPIQLNIGNGTIFSPDVLTLNSDNISSGRRRIGMLVYVIEENEIYQYQIPNFESIWSGVTGATGPGGQTVVFADFGTTIKGNTPEGVSFISAWTANTIDGISGETSTTAVWKKFLPKDVYVTGGTYSGGTLTLINNTGGTFDIGGFFTGSTDVYVTGGTFNKQTETLTLNKTDGSSVLVTGFTDVYVTGGTYSGGTLFLTNNSGTTFEVTGFSETTGGTSTIYYGQFIFDTVTTLTSAIPNPSSTAPIDVVDTTGFFAPGYMKIDNEIIGYLGKTATSFTGITRGIATSNGTSHVSGSSVSQAQWNPSNTPAQVKIDETDISYGVTLSGMGDVIITNAGLYNFQFSIQFENFGNDFGDVTVWFVINGNNIPKTSSYSTITGTHAGKPGAIIMTVNLLYNCGVGDTMSLMWKNARGFTCITSIPPIDGTVPQSPGVIFTVNKIA